MSECYCKQNFETDQNLLVVGNMGVNSGVAVGKDLNTNNQNCFGLLSSYGNIYSNGNIYISNDDNNDKYTFLKNDGSITCNNILMNNVLIGKNNKDSENNDEYENDGENIISIGKNTNSLNKKIILYLLV